MSRASAKAAATEAKTTVARRPMGRPSEFTHEIAEEICNRLAKGESLKSICADQESGWLPGETTVRRWLSGGEKWNEDFRRLYARARAEQADHYFDEIIAIADSPNTTVGPDGEPELRDPQRDRLRIDARKWVAGKLSPRKYGEKQLHELSGQIQVEAARALDPRGLSDDQREVMRQVLATALEQLGSAEGEVIEGEYEEKE